MQTPPDGVTREHIDGFQLYRNGISADDKAVGCVVLVTVDTSDANTARAWVDSVFDALASEPNPHPGGISAHFHIRDDGRRVVNYAEWTSAEAHVDALSSAGDGIGSTTPEWQRVLSFPGVRHVSVERFRPNGV